MSSSCNSGIPGKTLLPMAPIINEVAVVLPEVMMLKQVMRWKLLSAFLAMLLVIFTIVGWLFNAISQLII